MSMFTLAISYLTSSNLPWFMDLTFQVPMQYCSLQHRTLLLSPVTSTTGYFFLLWLHLFILSVVISALISSSMLGTYWPGEFFFQHPIILPFHIFSKCLIKVFEYYLVLLILCLHIYSTMWFFFFTALSQQTSYMDVRVGLWRKLTAKELMLLNCGVEDSWESLGLLGDPTSTS